MKVGKLPFILVILLAAFSVAYVVSNFIKFSPNGIVITGQIGPSIQLTISSNIQSIYINLATNNPSLANQSAVLTASEPCTTYYPSCSSGGSIQTQDPCVGSIVYWQSDLPGYFVNSTGGSSTDSRPYCVLGVNPSFQSTSQSACTCSITFHSLNSPGIVNIFSTDLTHSTTVAPGQTSLTVNWPSTPCVGIVTQCNATSGGNYCANSGPAGCDGGHGYPNYLFTSQSACQQQSGCAWFNPSANYNEGTCSSSICGYISGEGQCNCATLSPADEKYYPMCGGNQTFDCTQYSTIATCLGDSQLRCRWDSNTNACQDYPCTNWNSNSNLCNSIASCTYTTGPCGGNAASCDSMTDQNTCTNQNGCTWAGYNPNETTTTTTVSNETSSTSSMSSITSTTSSSTTTTTSAAPTFTGSNFTCSSITNGWSCNVNYNNNLGQNAVVLFIYTDSNGNVVSAPAPVAQSGSGTASSAFFCNSYPTGTYNVAWKAFAQSDTNLQNPVAWSLSTERQTITC